MFTLRRASPLVDTRARAHLRLERSPRIAPHRNSGVKVVDVGGFVIMRSFLGVLPVFCFLLVSLVGTADGKAGASLSSSRRPEYPRVEEEPDAAHASVAHVDPSGPTWSDDDAASYTSEHYWYNEVTGETSKVDPTLQLQGHHDKRHDRTYWLDPGRMRDNDTQLS